MDQSRRLSDRQRRMPGRRKITEYDPPSVSTKKRKQRVVGDAGKKKVSTIGISRGKRSAFDSDRGMNKSAAGVGGMKG